MTLYLSRLTLNRAASSSALMPLLNPHDSAKRTDAHHRLIWSVFSDSAARERDFLWRNEGKGKFYTLSRRRPRLSELFQAHETKIFDPVLHVGDRLQYTLRANATRDRAIISRMEKHERRGKSRRVDVVMDLLHRAGEEESRASIRSRIAQSAAEAWIARQGAAKGFVARSTVVEGYSTIELGRTRRDGATFGILDLAGEIEVVDPRTFLAALAVGFGRAKGWGCGLMLIRRSK